MSDRRRRAKEMVDAAELGCGWAVLVTRLPWRRAGQCNHIQRLIEIDGRFLRLAPDDCFEDLVRHEIAHARVGMGHGHDKTWREAFRELGGTYDFPSAVPDVLRSRWRYWVQIITSLIKAAGCRLSRAVAGAC